MDRHIRFLFVLSVAALCLTAWPHPGKAQPAHLAADLVFEPRAYSSEPRDLVEIDGTLFFTADHPLTGNELWRWDGAGEARLVKDLCPGRCSATPNQLVPFRNGLYYFFASVEEASGLSLYSTDGTAAGTERLLELGPLTSPLLVATSRSLFFTRWTEEAGWELWHSDGTAVGTGLLLDIFPGPLGSGSHFLTAVGDLLFFTADEDGGGFQLFRSDGTAEGTWKVSDARTATFPSYIPESEGLFHHDGRVFYGASDEEGCGLWVSDGTVEGTTKLQSLGGVEGQCHPPTGTDMAMTGDGVLIFSLFDDSAMELRPWRTDGTAGGTFKLADVREGSLNGPDPFEFTAVNGQVFFAANRDFDSELWVTDGTVAGTHRVRNINPATHSWPESLTAFGDRLLFTAWPQELGRSLWISDGTEAGTRLVADISPERNSTMTYPGGEKEFVPFGDRIVLTADDVAHGAELWITDGTTAGTVLAADVDGNVGSSDPAELLVFEGAADIEEQLAFVAENEVWTWVGLPLNLTGFHDDSLRLRDLIRLGEHVFWTQSRRRFLSSELWAFETSELVPRRLVELDCPAPSLLGPFQDRLFFAGYDADAPQRFGLYTSDGTAAGTSRLADLPDLVPSGPDGPEPCYPMPAVELDGRLYIQAGSLFLVTDGTAEGTGHLFNDGFCGPFECVFLELVRWDDALYFTVTQGGGVVELRRSSGEGGQADLLASFPRQSPSFAQPQLRDLTVASGRLFFIAETEEEGTELWTSDGTVAGTRLVVDLFPGPDGSSPRELFAAGDELYFSARRPAEGRELWVTDGTAAGTRLVADVNPGPDASAPQDLAEIGGRLVFAADDGVHGLEPWTSDGTAAGTRMLQDIQPGIFPSDPRSYVVSGDDVFFNAGTLAEGFELWSLPRSVFPDDVEPPDSGSSCPDGEACLLDGRFTVAVSWKNQHGGGTTGVGRPLPFSDESSLFWFFKETNVELIVKILDGRKQNGHFWVFYGGLSDVEYWITVTDSETGAQKTYHNPPGEICGQGDTRAFVE